MSLKVRAWMDGIRVVSVTRHAPDHLEVGMAGGEGHWPDENRSGPYGNLTATFRIFSNVERFGWREHSTRNERVLTAWRDEDTPLRVLDLSAPVECVLILDEPGQRSVSFAATRQSAWEEQP